MTIGRRGTNMTTGPGDNSLSRWSREEDGQRDSSTVSTPASEIVQNRIRELEKNNESIADFMMMLSSEQMTSVRRHFYKEKDASLNLVDFCRVMLEHLDKEDTGKSELELTRHLVDLFAEANINGDDTMEWEELTSFIVDATRTSASGGLPDQIKEYRKSAVTDSVTSRRHTQKIDSIINFDSIDVVVSWEQPYTTCRILNSHDGELLKELPAHQGAQMYSAAHVQTPQMNVLVTSASDNKVSFWDWPTLWNRHTVADEKIPHMKLFWSPEIKQLLSGDLEGNLHHWNLEQLKPVKTTESHSDAIMDIIVGAECIMTASMDSDIKLWDLNGQKKRSLTDHKKGVLTLSYNEEYKLLVSAGFDHTPMIWNPFSGTKDILVGHKCPLVGAYTVPYTPQIISVDVSGSVRIWDIRTFRTVQTFQVGESTSEVTAIQYCPKVKRIICGTKELKYYDYDDRINPTLTADTPVVWAAYNDVTMQFFTASDRDVKIWNAISGELLEVYRNVMEAEITTASFDDRKRKLFVGDHLGRIQCFNCQNGAFMKDFQTHKDAEVSSLTYCTSNKSLLSVGTDRSLRIHDELPISGGVVLRDIKGTYIDADISSISFCENSKLVAAGLENHKIFVWDFDKGKFEACLEFYGVQDSDEHPHIRGIRSIADLKVKSGRAADVARSHVREQPPKERLGITALQVLYPAPALIAFDSAGGVFLWSVKPHKLKYTCVGRYNFTPVKKNAIILQLEYIGEHSLLIGADDRGHLYCWDLKQFLNEHTAFKDSDKTHKLVHLGTSQSFFLTDVSYNEEDADDFVSPKWTTKAHEDCILSLELNLEPPILITSAYDCMTRIWDFDGNSLGALHQSKEYAGRDWHFRVDLQARATEELENVRQVLAKVRNSRPLSPPPSRTPEIAQGDYYFLKMKERQNNEEAKQKKQRNVSSQAKLYDHVKKDKEYQQGWDESTPNAPHVRNLTTPQAKAADKLAFLLGDNRIKTGLQHTPRHRAPPQIPRLSFMSNGSLPDLHRGPSTTPDRLNETMPANFKKVPKPGKISRKLHLSGSQTERRSVNTMKKM